MFFDEMTSFEWLARGIFQIGPDVHRNPIDRVTSLPLDTVATCESGEIVLLQKPFSEWWRIYF